MRCGAETAVNTLWTDFKRRISADTFVDVKSTAWYSKAVNSVVDRGLMGGYPDGTFKPDKPVTRAELAQVLYNLIKQK